MSKRLISKAPLILQVKMWDLISLGMLGATGFLVGYAIKKLAKLFLFFVGVFLLTLIGLEYMGVIKIYYDKLGEVLFNALISLQAMLPEIASMLSGLFYSLSFSAGFLLGLMKG
ncbi:MAG: FUN14 domain-containing protein [Candidatus Bathyarchaeales archaeon]